MMNFKDSGKNWSLSLRGNLAFTFCCNIDGVLSTVFVPVVNVTHRVILWVGSKYLMCRIFFKF